MGTQCSCLHNNREDVEGSFTSGLELDEDQLQICAAANGNAQNGTTILGTRAPRSAPRNAPLTAASLQNTLLPSVVQIQLPSRTPRNHDDSDLSVDDEEDGVVLPAVNPFVTGTGCRRLSLSTAPSSTSSPQIHSHNSATTTVPVSAARHGFLSVGQATPSSCTSLASGILHLQHSDNKFWLSRSGCPLPPPAAQSRKHNGGKGLSLFDPASSGGSSMSSAAYGGARSATTTIVGLGDMHSLRGQNSAGYNNGNDPWTPLTATAHHHEGDEALSVAVSHIREQQQLDSGSRCLSSRHTHRRGRHRTLVGSTPTAATLTTTHRGGSAFPGTFATINDLRRTASSVQTPLVMRCNSSNLSHYNKQLQQPPDEVQWQQKNASYQSTETAGFDDEAFSGEMLPPSRHSLREDNDEPQVGSCAPVRLTLATFAIHDE